MEEEHLLEVGERRVSDEQCVIEYEAFDRILRGQKVRTRHVQVEELYVLWGSR